MTRKQAIMLVLVLCAFALIFGFGGPHGWGYWSFSPFGLLLAIFLLLVLVP